METLFFSDLTYKIINSEQKPQKYTDKIKTNYFTIGVFYQKQDFYGTRKFQKTA